MAFDIGKYNGDFKAFVDFASAAARKAAIFAKHAVVR